MDKLNIEIEFNEPEELRKKLGTIFGALGGSMVHIWNEAPTRDNCEPDEPSVVVADKSKFKRGNSVVITGTWPFQSIWIC